MDFRLPAIAESFCGEVRDFLAANLTPDIAQRGLGLPRD